MQKVIDLQLVLVHIDGPRKVECHLVSARNREAGAVSAYRWISVMVCRADLQPITCSTSPFKQHMACGLQKIIDMPLACLPDTGTTLQRKLLLPECPVG